VSAPTEETSSGSGSAWLLPAGVLLLASVAVALAFNPAPHTGGDNAAYVTLGYSLLEYGSYTELFDPAAYPHTKYPPVFPALLALLMGVGVRGWAGLKLVAAVSSVAAVGLTWLWARRRLGDLPAAGIALALGLSSAVIYYSHWILSDPTFLAFTLLGLWALERADTAWAEEVPERDGTVAHEPREGGPPAMGWLALGVAATGLAYFTRSAGLPLMVAVLGWLALRRRWKELVGSAVALGVPALAWWLRSRSVPRAEGEYGVEFWLVDPYQPELGQVGLGGLIGRVVGNTGGYLTQHIPGGVIGSQAPALPVVGILLVGLAVVGWVLTCRRRIGPVELFFPLYAGLILLWPEVWSGDRFALPLFPVLFVYAGWALLRGGLRLGRWAPGTLGAAALLALLLPALGGWMDQVRTARTCAAAVEQGGAFACAGGRWTRFSEAAAWTGHNLPEGSAVLSRKPRMFYVLGGVPSRTFPFQQDFAAHRRVATESGARYVLLDEVDGLASHYVGGAIRQEPGAWCALQGFGAGQGIGTQLLGLLPDATDGPAAAPGEVRIGRCPDGYRQAGAGSVPAEGPRGPQSSSVIPLLAPMPELSP